jgi:hypothetical protein
LIMFLYKRNRMLPALLFISLGLIIGIERYAIWVTAFFWALFNVSRYGRDSIVRVLYHRPPLHNT